MSNYLSLYDLSTEYDYNSLPSNSELVDNIIKGMFPVTAIESIYLGSKTQSNLYLGSRLETELYLGNKQIFG